MPIVTLLEKAHDFSSLKSLDIVLEHFFKGLKVSFKIHGRVIQEWIQVEVTGEDEAVALQLLDREIGLTPTHGDKVGNFSFLRGKIVNSRKASSEINVDVGVFTPKVVYANVSLQRLQSQLADGKHLSLQNLAELYCLYDDMPFQVKIVDSNLSSKKRYFEAELSEQQLSLFSSWLGASLDRLIVLDARFGDVDYAIRASKHFRDVVKIQSMGMLEHAVVCKLGTDAVGLIPEIARYLRTANFAPFSPKKILHIINRSTL
jgi:hypothetical protein